VKPRNPARASYETWTVRVAYARFPPLSVTRTVTWWTPRENLWRSTGEDPPFVSIEPSPSRSHE
jgi:hypothetical protein